MKLLVIGAQGQLARSLVEAATSQHFDVVPLGRPQFDLLQPESIDGALKLLEPQIVINTAAYTAVDKAEEEPDLTCAINSDGARRVAEACATTKTPLIHISTDYVFDGSKRKPKRESDPTAPINVYGRSKLDGERAVAAICPQHLLLRTAWIYSPFGHNFAKTVLRLAESRSEFNVVDDQIGNPTYAPHLAAGILQIARQILKGGSHSLPWGTYHLAGSGEASWHRLACEVLDRSASLGGRTARVRAITTSQYPTRAKRPADSRLNCSKCTDTFGVTLPEWRSGVADCVARLLAESGAIGYNKGVNGKT
jgi:dTDP-4-dehydrorhamnose reductase